MTVAVCINCGTQKEGSFTKCPHCDFAPVSDLELAYSLAFSDSHYPPDTLAEIGDEIARTGVCGSQPLAKMSAAASASLRGAFVRIGR